MADQADVIVHTGRIDELTDRFQPNRKYEFVVGSERLGETVDPYGKWKKLLVRTALVRHEDFKVGNAPTVRGPADAARLVKHLGEMDQEYFITLAINNSGKCVAIHETSVGSSVSTGVTVPDVLKVALLTGVTAIIVIHNHPSGKAESSEADELTMAQLQRSCKCLGFTLLDAMVVTYSGWLSITSHDSGVW